ncbi:SigE family RNA polymerase sigma factor [Nocardioides jensenii]|uniref:SigE family RNA polymerase sigma factor n=1 Tax=Nocardioides jensenii TaxID=1843 RepID=UPI00082F47ED|nr:SigE family RNA polymerase sigma factor [Nocardioides jensenii]
MTLFSGRANREADYVDFVAARRLHLRRIAYAICGDWHLADDLLQDALVKLYVAWPRVRRDEQPEAYVRQILVRVNIDEHRRRMRRPQTVELTGGDEAAQRPGLPAEERSALFDALQQMPEMQRKTVVLRHWLGLSVTETAHELGIGEGTVKSHTSRGLDTLRALLAPADVD